MNIHCCSFASESFASRQIKQSKYFAKVGFNFENIHLYNPTKLKNKFFRIQPNASELNKFGWSYKTSLKLGIKKTYDYFLSEANK